MSNKERKNQTQAININISPLFFFLDSAESSNETNSYPLLQKKLSVLHLNQIPTKISKSKSSQHTSPPSPTPLFVCNTRVAFCQYAPEQVVFMPPFVTNTS